MPQFIASLNFCHYFCPYLPLSIVAKAVHRAFLTIALLGYFVFSPLANAVNSDAAENGLSQKSQQILAVCQGCHGENLSGNKILHSPALAGQSLTYLNSQIKKFQQGIRGANKKDITGQQMANIALTLTDTDSLLETNKYISQRSFVPEKMLGIEIDKTNSQAGNAQKIAQQLKQGSNYYQGKCGACHGGRGEGNDRMSAPRLNNLSASYISKQMMNFSNGIRGSHSDDKYGRQMAMMAKTSSGQELKNIIMFISAKGSEKKQVANHE